MKKFIQSIQAKLSAFLSPVPEIQEEYVDKVVYLLRRDFDTTEQNEIILSIGQKLSELREQDMRDMEKKYAVLQENTNTLKHRMAIN
jgi:hypothetical protein